MKKEHKYMIFTFLLISVFVLGAIYLIIFGFEMEPSFETQFAIVTFFEIIIVKTSIKLWK